MITLKIVFGDLLVYLTSEGNDQKFKYLLIIVVMNARHAIEKVPTHD